MNTFKNFFIATIATATLLVAHNVASAQTDNTDVNADILSTLDLVVSTPVAGLWALNASGVNDNSDMVLTAQANVPYNLQQNADAHTTKGAANASKLFEHDGTSYAATTSHPVGGGGLFIASDLLVGEAAATPVAITTTAAAMPGISNEPVTTGQDHSVLLRQNTTFADRSLNIVTGSNYYIELTFTIVSAF